MDSLARAREVATEIQLWIQHNDCIPAAIDAKTNDYLTQRIATAIDEARLEEAKWWVVRNPIVPYMSEGGCKRIAELEASLRERGRCD